MVKYEKEKKDKQKTIRFFVIYDQFICFGRLDRSVSRISRLLFRYPADKVLLFCCLLCYHVGPFRDMCSAYDSYGRKGYEENENKSGS